MNSRASETVKPARFRMR